MKSLLMAAGFATFGLCFARPAFALHPLVCTDGRGPGTGFNMIYDRETTTATIAEGTGPEVALFCKPWPEPNPDDGGERILRHAYSRCADGPGKIVVYMLTGGGRTAEVKHVTTDEGGTHEHLVARLYCDDTENTIGAQ